MPVPRIGPLGCLEMVDSIEASGIDAHERRFRMGESCI
jgi:hypothetical protein